MLACDDLSILDDFNDIESIIGRHEGVYDKLSLMGRGYMARPDSVDEKHRLDRIAGGGAGRTVPQRIPDVVTGQLLGEEDSPSVAVASRGGVVVVGRTYDSKMQSSGKTSLVCVLTASWPHRVQVLLSGVKALGAAMHRDDFDKRRHIGVETVPVDSTIALLVSDVVRCAQEPVLLVQTTGKQLV